MEGICIYKDEIKLLIFFHKKKNKKNCNKLNNSLNIPGTTDVSRGEGVVTIPWTTDLMLVVGRGL